MTNKYRVFVSHCHSKPKDHSRYDNAATEAVSRRIRQLGLSPIVDAAFPPGGDITDQVHRSIAYAHLVVVVLTERSLASPWVQQELGFAVGSGVPILSLCMGVKPSGMVQTQLPLELPKDPRILPGALKTLLTRQVIADVVTSAQQVSRPTYYCAALADERTERLLAYSDAITRFSHGAPHKVRVCGAFTSFSLPSENNSHSWQSREGGRSAKSAAERAMLTKERRALQQHAHRGGCDIMIDPFISSPDLTTMGRVGRLTELMQFVKSMPEDDIRLVVRVNQTEGNLILLGDWMMAESMSPRPWTGFRHTVFSQHAPSVSLRVHEFDAEFEEIYSHDRCKGATNKADALYKIERSIARIKHRRER